MLSAIVLTHNDEKLIARCLESLSWCDEIILVDDYSTDQTLSLVQKTGAKVYRRRLNNDFAAQRNFALKQAQGEWVLFVDSDEVVGPPLAKEIQLVISTPKDKRILVNGYFIRRRDFLWGRELRYGETGQVKLLRLAQKNSGLWAGKVHEVWRIKGVSGEFTNPLWHYPHSDVAQFINEINRYSSIRAQELFEQGTEAHFWQIIAYPSAKFFLNYCWRLGFLDGTAGAVLAIMMSFHSFLVRAKLWHKLHSPQNQ